MRYLEQCLYRGHAPDSRAVESFVADDLLPKGKALDEALGEATHPEHVVPCVMLCAEATTMLRHGVPSEEVAAWIEPFLRVVMIPQAVADRLDGPMRLKTRMPDGWAFGRGCIYARLHAAGVLFTAPQEGPECLCPENHVPVTVAG
jgi:hypothetical protein